MIKISGCNFITTDIDRSIQIYNSIFDWEISENSPNHGELLIVSNPKFYLYFDNSFGKCPTQAGSITLQIHADFSEKEKLNESNADSRILDSESILSIMLNSEIKRKIWNDNFYKEYQDTKFRYESWLDPWKSRIWLVFSNVS